MTEPTAVLAENQRTTMGARIGWGILIVATLYVCYFSHLGAIGFVGPDEPRYAWIARDMAETGDWVTPRLYGKPWFEKPVLYYWGAALCFKLFGVSEAAARLPSAISALLATVALAWLALRLYGAETARWLLLLLPTTIGMIGFSHAAATDMPFSGMLTIAMVCAAVVIGLTRNANSPVVPQTPWLGLILFGFFLGLAVLAKGPAAIILSGGAIFSWALFTKRWRDAFRLFHPAALVSFSLTALPWYILCARRNPDFFRIFIIEHNIKRFLTPEFQHIQPFWYYGPILFVALYPWIGMAFSGITYAFRNKFEMRMDPVTIFPLTWCAFPILFFSISKSKLPGYILPAIPALVAYAALALANSLKMKKVPAPAGFAVLALTPVFVIATVSVIVLSLGKPKELQTYGAASGFLAFLGLTGVLVFALSKLRKATVISGLLAWVCFVVITNRAAIPWIDSKVSARSAAEGAKNHLPHSEIDTAATYKLQRGLTFGLNFYLHREIAEWSPPAGRSSIIFTTQSGSSELELMGIHCFDYTADPAIEICVDSSSVAPLPDSLPRSGQPQ